MTKNNRLAYFLLSTLIFISFTCLAKSTAVDLEGTWKIENKDSFEEP